MIKNLVQCVLLIGLFCFAFCFTQNIQIPEEEFSVGDPIAIVTMPDIELKLVELEKDKAQNIANIEQSEKNIEQYKLNITAINGAIFILNELKTEAVKEED